MAAQQVGVLTGHEGMNVKVQGQESWRILMVESVEKKSVEKRFSSVIFPLVHESSKRKLGWCLRMTGKTQDSKEKSQDIHLG